MNNNTFPNCLKTPVNNAQIITYKFKVTTKNAQKIYWRLRPKIIFPTLFETELIAIKDTLKKSASFKLLK